MKMSREQENRRSSEIGDRIRFWKDDKKWYKGRVEATRMSMEEDLGKVVAEHEVKYDDGDVEWLYLGQETFEILKGESSKQPAKKKQKRKIVDSDSEDEFIPSDEEPEEEEYVPDEPIVTPSPKKKKKKTTPSSLSSFASFVLERLIENENHTEYYIIKKTQVLDSCNYFIGYIYSIHPVRVLVMGQHAHDVDSAFSFLRPIKFKTRIVDDLTIRITTRRLFSYLQRF